LHEVVFDPLLQRAVVVSRRRILLIVLAVMSAQQAQGGMICSFSAECSEFTAGSVRLALGEEGSRSSEAPLRAHLNLPFDPLLTTSGRDASHSSSTTSHLDLAVGMVQGPPADPSPTIRWRGRESRLDYSSALLDREGPVPRLS
jgi:hypothetical protein